MGLLFNREPKERTKTFTRHTSRIEYIDGTEEEVVWDSKKHRKSGLMKFHRYTGIELRMGHPGFRKEVVYSIGVPNVKKFETIDSEKKEFTYTI